MSRSNSGASSRVATQIHPSPIPHTPYRRAQGRNWRCALLLRLPGSFVPPRPWHWTIPVHPTVFSPACKKLQPAGLQPAPCTFPRLQSLPSKLPPASVVGLLLLHLLHNPALDHLKSHQSPPLSEPFATPISYPICPGNLTHKTTLTPNAFTRQLLIDSFFPNSSSIESKPPAQLNTKRHRQSTTSTYRELPVC